MAFLFLFLSSTLDNKQLSLVFETGVNFHKKLTNTVVGS